MKDIHSRIEYFLNAVLYCIWLEGLRCRDIVERVVRMAFYPVLLLLPKKRRERFKRIQKIKIHKYNRWNENAKTGWIIADALDTLECSYLGYCAMLSFILTGTIDNWLDGVNSIVLVILFATPIFVGFIPLYRSVIANDLYLEYFKIFRMENEQWHRRWHCITTAFCVGGALSFILGIVSLIVLTYLFL